MKRIRVRFNLGLGKNFMKWKVEYPATENTSAKTVYLEPTMVQLVMEGITLKNQKSTAKKIFGGQNKTVCAWVLCDTLKVNTAFLPEGQDETTRVSYNPRVTPNWVYMGLDVDGVSMKRLVSCNRSLFRV